MPAADLIAVLSVLSGAAGLNASPPVAPAPRAKLVAPVDATMPREASRPERAFPAHGPPVDPFLPHARLSATSAAFAQPGPVWMSALMSPADENVKLCAALGVGGWVPEPPPRDRRAEGGAASLGWRLGAESEAGQRSTELTRLKP